MVCEVVCEVEVVVGVPSDVVYEVVAGVTPVCRVVVVGVP